MVSGEAIIINNEETGSLKEKRDYKGGSVHTHAHTQNMPKWKYSLIQHCLRARIPF